MPHDSPDSPVRRLVRAGLACALVDGAWATLNTHLRGGTFAALWTRVAGVALGPAMQERGAVAVVAGLGTHVFVASSSRPGPTGPSR